MLSCIKDLEIKFNELLMKLNIGLSRLISGDGKRAGAQQESTHHPESDAHPQGQVTQLYSNSRLPLMHLGSDSHTNSSQLQSLFHTGTIYIVICLTSIC